MYQWEWESLSNKVCSFFFFDMNNKLSQTTHTDICYTGYVLNISLRSRGWVANLISWGNVRGGADASVLVTAEFGVAIIVWMLWEVAVFLVGKVVKFFWKLWYPFKISTFVFEIKQILFLSEINGLLSVSVSNNVRYEYR